MDDVVKSYPALKKHVGNVVIQQGTNKGSDDPRQLEFYPPWEEENPNPGKITLELYRDFKGKALTDAVAGDLMHYLGATDPSTNKPVDPTFLSMKNEVKAARTPKQIKIDRQEYEDGKKGGDITESYDDWLKHSRIDAYIRGYVTPDKVDEWRKNGWYNDPRMKTAVEKIKKYMAGQPENQ